MSILAQTVHICSGTISVGSKLQDAGVEKAQIELAVEPLRETIEHGGGAHRHRLRCGNDLHRYFRCFYHGLGMGVGGHAAKVTQEALPSKSGTRRQLRRPRFSASQQEYRQEALGFRFGA